MIARQRKQSSCGAGPLRELLVRYQYIRINPGESHQLKRQLLLQLRVQLRISAHFWARFGQVLPLKKCALMTGTLP
jgi:hypothetical protein